MKNFWRVFYLICAVSTVVLIFLVVSLFKGDQITYTPSTEESSDITTPTIQNYSPIRGNSTDPTVIVYSYSNYLCPACKGVDSALSDIIAKQPQVAIVWKDFPNSSLYPESVNAAVAARCAGDQKKYWEFHDRLFDNQSSLGRDTYIEIAKALELNEKKFTKCLDSQSNISFVNADYTEGTKLSIISAPTIFVNGQSHTGALRPQELELMVKQALDALILK